MPKFLVANYYTASVIHEVEADSRDAAIEVAEQLEDDHEELASSLQYDESVVVEGSQRDAVNVSEGN